MFGSISQVFHGMTSLLPLVLDANVLNTSTLDRGVSQVLLGQWGFEYQKARYQIDHQGHSVISVRAQVLERFLAKIARLLGIPIHYRMEFAGLCTAADSDSSSREYRDTKRVAIRPIDVSGLLPMLEGGCHENATDQQNVTYLLCDVLVGADGAASSVRYARETRPTNTSCSCNDVLGVRVLVTVPIRAYRTMCKARSTYRSDLRR
jgi:hypothetical protein